MIYFIWRNIWDGYKELLVQASKLISPHTYWIYVFKCVCVCVPVCVLLLQEVFQYEQWTDDDMQLLIGILFVLSRVSCLFHTNLFYLFICASFVWVCICVGTYFMCCVYLRKQLQINFKIRFCCDAFWLKYL